MRASELFYEVAATVMLPGHEAHVVKGTVTIPNATSSLDEFRREMKKNRSLSFAKTDGTVVEIQGMVFDYTIVQFSQRSKPKRKYQRKAKQHAEVDDSQRALLGKSTPDEFPPMPPRSHSPSPSPLNEEIDRFNERNTTNGHKRRTGTRR